MSETTELPIPVSTPETQKFDPVQTWGIGEIAPYNIGPDQTAVLLKDVPADLRKVVQEDMNTLSARIAYLSRDVKASIDNGWANPESTYVLPIAEGRAEYTGNGKRNQLPLTEENKAVIDTLQAGLNLQLTGVDQPGGRRIYMSTEKPGLSFLVFQNDGSGNITNQITEVRAVLSNPGSKREKDDLKGFVAPRPGETYRMRSSIPVLSK